MVHCSSTRSWTQQIQFSRFAVSHRPQFPAAVQTNPGEKLIVLAVTVEPIGIHAQLITEYLLEYQSVLFAASSSKDQHQTVLAREVSDLTSVVKRKEDEIERLQRELKYTRKVRLILGFALNNQTD